ncbi:MAG: N-acetylglucosamine kinase [Candidatus Xenobia bacterium]
MGYVIGIDGGGTRTHALLASLEGEVLGAGWAGASNLLRVGPQVTRDSIAAAVAQAQEAAQSDELHRQVVGEWRLCGVCVGFAGADRREVHEQLERILHDLLGDVPVLLKNDAEIALAGAHGTGPGAVVLSGSGSIALARGADGKVVRGGGWGWIVGDEGSATWVARQALTRLMHEHDQRAASSSLLSHLEVSRAADLIWKLHSDPSPSSVLAAIFPKVLAAARDGDAFAQGLLQDAGRELADLGVSVMCRAVAPDTGWGVVYGGSVLIHSPYTLHSFEESLQRQLPGVRIMAPRGTPAEGAVRLAIELVTR